MRALSNNSDHNPENSQSKKTYAVTNDDNRKKFIKIWDNGATTIKKVTIICIYFTDL